MLFGAHCGGGIKKALDKAVEMGADAVQLFVQSPRTWRFTSADSLGSATGHLQRLMLYAEDRGALTAAWAQKGSWTLLTAPCLRRTATGRSCSRQHACIRGKATCICWRLRLWFPMRFSSWLATAQNGPLWSDMHSNLGSKRESASLANARTFLNSSPVATYSCFLRFMKDCLFPYSKRWQQASR